MVGFPLGRHEKGIVIFLANMTWNLYHVCGCLFSVIVVCSKKNWAEMEQKIPKTWFSFNSHQPGRRKYLKNLEAWIKWTPLCWCMLSLWSQQKFKGLVIHLSSKTFHFHQFPFYSSKYNLANRWSQKSPQQCCNKLVFKYINIYIYNNFL